MKRIVLLIGIVATSMRGMEQQDHSLAPKEPLYVWCSDIGKYIHASELNNKAYMQYIEDVRRKELALERLLEREELNKSILANVQETKKPASKRRHTQ